MIMPVEKSKPLMLDSTISEVTVYHEGAIVRRTTPLTRGPDGYPCRVTLVGLPLTLIDGTMRTRIAPLPGTDAEIPLVNDSHVSLKIKTEWRQPDPDKALVTELERLRREENSLGERVAVVERSSAILDELALPARPAPADATTPLPSPVPAMVEAAAFCNERRKKLVDELYSLYDRQAVVREKIDTAEKQYNERQAQPEVKPSDLCKAVEVCLRRTDALAAEVLLVVEYFVPGAQWSPGYSLHVDGATGEATLEMKALLTQSSGEDWHNVNLRLSTALPEQWSELPELQSLRIGRRQRPLPKRGWREPPEGAASLFDDYDAFHGRHEPPTSFLYDEMERQMAAPCCSAPPSEMVAGGANCEEAPPEPLYQAKMAMREKKSRGMPAAIARRVASAMRKEAPPPAAPAQGASFSNDDELPATSQPSADLLEYGNLCMESPDAPERGTLTVQQVSAYRGIPSLITGIVHAEMTKARTLPSLPRNYLRPQTKEGYDYAYVCAALATVPSHPRFRNIAVATQPARIEIRHVAVPRESAEVFRVGRFFNPMAQPLLEGPADIYIDGNFLLTTRLETVAPKGFVDLGFGVDQRVKVARNTTFEEASGGIMGGKLGLRHAIAIDIVNNSGRPIALEVRERVPVKNNEDKEIDIQLVKVVPPWEEYREPPERVRGRYQWKVTLSAGEKRSLAVSYEIHISAKNELVGGNRREA
jgi:hypothetical protein